MTCPKCGGKLKILQTIAGRDNEEYRHRRCLICDHRFYTTEFEVEYGGEYEEAYKEARREQTRQWRRNMEERKNNE